MAQGSQAPWQPVPGMGHLKAGTLMSQRSTGTPHCPKSMGSCLPRPALREEEEGPTVGFGVPPFWVAPFYTYSSETFHLGEW